MPATFPSHAGAVLPLKLWRPSWFDGVALVVGAALPDLMYFGGCCGWPYTAGWDHLTHVSIAGTGLGLPALSRHVAVTVHIGRQRLLVRWHGPAPAVPTRPFRFWATAATICVLGLAAVAVSTIIGERHAMVGWLPPLPRPVVLITRVTLVIVAALCVAALRCDQTAGRVPRSRRRRTYSDDDRIVG